MCKGNIASLLDYETVLQGALPQLGSSAFKNLFTKCEGLISSPKLPFTELTEQCYLRMFLSSGLLLPPELPASIIPTAAYGAMFAETPVQGYLDLRHVTEIQSSSSTGTIDNLGRNLIC